MPEAHGGVDGERASGSPETRPHLSHTKTRSGARLARAPLRVLIRSTASITFCAGRLDSTRQAIAPREAGAARWKASVVDLLIVNLRMMVRDVLLPDPQARESTEGPEHDRSEYDRNNCQHYE